MRDIAEIDSVVRAASFQFADALDASYQALIEEGPLPLDGTGVTEAILLRLGAYYASQTRIKEALGKRYLTSGADYFVETVLFYLRALVETHSLHVEVASERTIAQRRSAMRPDITLWRGSDCLAFVECKTQLGWKRHNWAADFEGRELRIVEDHLDARGFLVVMTRNNWAGFGDDPRIGKKFFCLSKPWPSSLDGERVRAGIDTPIEGLFRHLLGLAQA